MARVARTGSVVCALVALVAAPGCHSAFGRLPQNERERWRDCRPYIAQGNMVRGDESWRLRDYQRQYAELPDEAARASLLGSLGCPAGVLQYVPALDADAGARPADPAWDLPPEGRIDESHDDFNHETRLAYAMVSAQGYRLALEGHPDSSPDRVRVTVSAHAGGAPRYADCHLVAFLAGATVIPGGESRYLREGLDEQASVDLSAASLSQLAAASLVRFRLCHDASELSAPQRAELARFAARWSSLATPTDAGPGAPDATTP